MTKVKVNRTIYLQYEYPYDKQHCGDDTQEEVVEYEKKTDHAILDSIMYGDYTEDVVVEFVEEQ